ncbi:MAG: CvpA family protein [Candidatus Omnitrophota bacterium]|nr:CvpA family protein [Candidatus Omnitrophota bacterium]
MPEILKSFNWLDILFVILLLGMIYKGSRTGVGGQILSLVGWFVLLFISIGYYRLLSEAIFGFLLQKWAKPVSFFLISVIIFTVIKFLERVFNVISDGELAIIERIGGALVASLRACLLFGVIGILLLLIPIDYARITVTEKSRTGMFFVDIDAQIYSWISDVTGVPAKRTKDELLNEFLATEKEK